MQKKYVANKALIVNEEGKVLLVRDAGKADHINCEGNLDFPGGRMDKGENPHEGLTRELKEELSIHADQFEIGPIVHSGLWGVGGDAENQPIIGLFHLVYPKQNLDIQLSEEHTQWLWVNPEKPYTDDMPSGVIETLDAYKQWKKQWIKKEA